MFFLIPFYTIGQLFSYLSLNMENTIHMPKDGTPESSDLTWI